MASLSQCLKKIKVNGPEAHPLYKFLKYEAKGVLGSTIKWNFTKFLISRDGEVLERFASATEPTEFEQKIIDELKKQFNCFFSIM